jgi:hypothetical protein
VTRWLLPALIGLWGGEAQAADLRRFAFVIGANQGGQEQVPLRYAVDDARSVLGVLQDLGGVRPVDSVLLEDPTWMELDVALGQLGGAVREARRAGARVELVLYYSGHSDERGLLLGATEIAWDELRGALGRVPADVRVTILDSCASGALLRSKGGTTAPPFLVDQASSVTGEAFLTSSTADEASQESDRIGGSFFTWHLVAGLRGAADADGDGLVTLSEAYDYTFRETRRSTENTLAGPQHPNYALDLKGQGDFVMTDLRAATARLVFDDSLDGRLWIADDDGDLFAEVDKVIGVPLDLSVPPGRYRLTLQARPTRWVLDVDVPPSGAVVVDGSDFARDDTALEETGLRGVVVAPAARTLRFGTQVVHNVGYGGPKDAVHGFALDLFDGTWHSVRGAELSMFVGLAKHDVHGAQLAGLAAMSGGDVQGAQLGPIFSYTHGTMRGFQGSGVVNVAGRFERGLQAAGFVNVAPGDTPAGTFSAQLAGAVNVSGGSRRGAQLAGLVNTQAGNLAGAQLAGVVNVAGGRTQGAQLAGVGNISGGSVRGLQLSFLFNGAERFDGAQISLINHGGGRGAQVGAINVAGELRGSQVGLVNVARRLDGEAVGLLSFIGNGYHAWEVGTDDVSPINTTFKFGSRHIYSAWTFGWDPVDGNGVTVAAGLGVHAELSRLWFDTDLQVGLLELVPGADVAPSGLRLLARPTLGFRVLGKFGLYVGPIVHGQVVLGSERLPSPSLVPGWETGERGSRFWVGYSAGLRIGF